MTAQRQLRGNRRKVRAYIGLGSNVGDKLGYIQQAMQLLKDVPGVTVLECSSFYEAEPTGELYSEWFVNAVASIDTSLRPDELLEICRDIEKRLTAMADVDARQKASGRIIDLDILFYGQETLESATLQIPHPRLHKRAFALVPLLEIAPEIRHPGLNKSVAQLHEELEEPEQIFLFGTHLAEEVEPD
ncbi:MAG: 2-amino-4-hydroxy-6-hydroxymethyldihydropteridine diphosphokinase [Cyanobacteria bacterium REEB67]|nr:2-amino-4-hydroxy-6-hydroxymethyldihydropteridine diphosphokinase [Cyanobacteria bacterium REEB67]